MSREALVSTRLDDLTPPAARPSLDGIWSTFLKVGTMQRRYPMLLGNGLQRTVIFRARANVRPGRHLSTFQLAQPGYIEVGDTPVEVELTSREREVLTRLARGSNAIAIAEVATLSPETIRTHTRNAMRKLGAHSRPHAIALAIKQRQIDP
jgi:DNA-binding CsgD family transcriptional regulator